jgi:hypothetical protein
MFLILRFLLLLKDYKSLAMQSHNEIFFEISVIILKKKLYKKYEGHTLRSTSSYNPDPIDLRQKEKNKS